MYKRQDINTVYRDMRGQWRRTWTARASFIPQSTARTKTSTAYCADLKLIVGHLQMPCDIRVTYGLWVFNCSLPVGLAHALWWNLAGMHPVQSSFISFKARITRVRIHVTHVTVAVRCSSAQLYASIPVMARVGCTTG